MFRVFNKNERIVESVVVVVELHHTTHKGSISVNLHQVVIFIILDWNFD